MSLIVARFIEANRHSPIEYFSAERSTVTVRLVDGQRFPIGVREWRQVGKQARFAHLELA